MSNKPQLSTIVLDDYDTHFLQYNGKWTGSDDQPDNPVWNQNFHNQSYHFTTENGASVSISWTGTRIVMKGAKRPNRGDFSATLDNGTKVFGSQYSETDVFNVTWFDSWDVPLGEHRLTLVNEVLRTNTSGLDTFVIDSIVLTGYPISVDGEVANSEQISTSASVAPTSSPSSTIPDETTASSSVPSSSSPPYSTSFTETITSATGLVTGNMASAIYTYSPSGHAPNFEPAPPLPSPLSSAARTQLAAAPSVLVAIWVTLFIMLPRVSRILVR